MELPLVNDLYVALVKALPRGLRGYVDPTLTVLGIGLVALLVRLTLLRWAVRWTARTPSPYDNIFVDALRRGLVVWAVLGAMYIQVEDLPWKARPISAVQTSIAALLILAVTLATIRFVAGCIRAYGTTHATTVGGTTLIRYIVSAILAFSGMAAVLGVFGISVIPAITALGVGGLAVALAFQDTLANVFAGLNMTLARQIRVGDYVELETGLDGFVVDVGWRTTILRTLVGLQIYIPNKKLAEALMINYTRGPGMAVELQFRVAHETDPDHVEAVVIDEMTQAVADVPGLRADEPPVIRLKVFGDWALEFKAFVAIVRYQDRFQIQHVLMKRLYKRLQAENIALARPRQSIQFESGAQP